LSLVDEGGIAPAERRSWSTTKASLLDIKDPFGYEALVLYVTTEVLLLDIKDRFGYEVLVLCVITEASLLDIKDPFGYEALVLYVTKLWCTSVVEWKLMNISTLVPYIRGD